MASYPSSRIHFYDELGTRIAFPVEGRQCGIALDVPKEMSDDISLTLDSDALPVHVQDAAPLPFSVWPASGPGQYGLQLSCGTIREHRTITIVPQNFTEMDFNSLLSDLTAVLPNSIALYLDRCGAQLGASQETQKTSSIEEEWNKLRDAINGTNQKMGIMQLLPILQQECNKILLPKLEIRTTEKMRRPEMSRLPQAISMPGNMVAEDELYQMFDVTVEESFNTYENQLVKTYVQALRSRMSRLQERVRTEPAPPGLLEQIEALTNEFHLIYMRSHFLRKVKPAMSADRVTMVILKNHAYRAIFEGYVGLNQQGLISLEEHALTTPLNKFPFLYQRWINLRVMNALLQVCAELGYQCVTHHWVKAFRKGAIIQVVNDGQAAVHLFHPVTNRHVSLIPWRAINESHISSTGEAPMAQAITIENPGTPLTVLLFDSKYRTAPRPASPAQPEAPVNDLEKLVYSIAPLKDDVEELLKCIESLKDPGQEIKYAALLYPGPNVQIAAEVQALCARPAQGDYLQNNICSVLRRYLA